MYGFSRNTVFSGILYFVINFENGFTEFVFTLLKDVQISFLTLLF